MGDRRSILASVHAVETPFSKGSEVVCQSPLCSVRFPQTGLEIEPRRYCSGKCRQHTSIIRRAGRLVAKLSDAEKLKVLRWKETK